ncbi:MAG: hypothetical protein HOP28_15730 [Gemmatimonadales bacterium]|nr:hypothetical protein [Gemmatimonadales bacterium]
MRRPLQRIVGIGMLVLATGCFSGSGGAAGLPRERRPYPVIRSPETATLAREPGAKWERNLDAAVARALSPAVDFSLFGLVLVAF